MPPSAAAAPPASGGLRRRIDKVSEQLTIEDAFEAPLRQVVQDLRRLLREANDSKHVYEKTKLRRAAARPDGDPCSSTSSGVQCDLKGAERAERDIYFYIGEAMESSSCQTEDVEIVTEHKDIQSKKELQEEREVMEELEVKEVKELDHSLSGTATSIASVEENSAAHAQETAGLEVGIKDVDEDGMLHVNSEQLAVERAAGVSDGNVHDPLKAPKPREAEWTETDKEKNVEEDFTMRASQIQVMLLEILEQQQQIRDEFEAHRKDSAGSDSSDSLEGFIDYA